MAEHRDALTVLGGHAVMEATRQVSALPPQDTTRDGDLGVTPELLSDVPRLGQRMVELGYETVRTDRPGVWSPVTQRGRGIHGRDTVDLIAPMALARGTVSSSREIRAARIGQHGKHAVSATRGTELSVLDRRLMPLRSFDGGPQVKAFIAGPAALLCAKAYKLHDRMDPGELRRNDQRLRPKDFADLYRLLLAITPEGALTVFHRGQEDQRLATAIALGREYLIDILTDGPNVAVMVADAWGDPSREQEFRAAVAQWLRRFLA